MRRIGKFMLGMTTLVTATALAFTFPLTIPVMLPFMVEGAALTSDSIHKKDFKNSIFFMNHKNEIYQNGLRLDKLVKHMFNKNKTEVFMEETLNCLKDLDAYKNGKKQTYKTLSQTATLRFLKDLSRMGYIDNLEYTKSNKKRKLFLEKLILGNKDKSLKKYNFYNISFGVTGKKIDDKEIEDYMNKMLHYMTNKEDKKEEVKTIETPTLKKENVDELGVSLDKPKLDISNKKENVDELGVTIKPIPMIEEPKETLEEENEYHGKTM